MLVTPRQLKLFLAFFIPMLLSGFILFPVVFIYAGCTLLCDGPFFGPAIPVILLGGLTLISLLPNKLMRKWSVTQGKTSPAFIFMLSVLLNIVAFFLGGVLINKIFY